MIDNEPVFGSGQYRSGKLLIILSEDEKLIFRVKKNLAPEGFQILVLPECKDVLKVAKTRGVRIIIVDMSAVPADCLITFHAMHHRFACPILAIVHGGEKQVAEAVEAGVDDYIADLGDETRLMVHVRALLRRNGVHVLNHPVEDRSYAIQDLFIDPLAREVKRGENRLSLTFVEFDILLALAKRAGLIISREELQEQIWGHGGLRHERTVDVHICRLRKKIEEDPAHPRLLMAIKGSGYSLKA